MRDMLPARIDPKPALWEGLADATIIKKDGKSLKVTVWMPTTGQAHFPSGGNIIAEATAQGLSKRSKTLTTDL